MDIYNNIYNNNEIDIIFKLFFNNYCKTEKINFNYI